MELRNNWEAAIWAATQDIPRLLSNPKVHLRANKSPLIVPIIIQVNSAQTTPSSPCNLF
jgi:hypothetical protein